MKEKIYGSAIWTPEENGHEKTNSPELIRRILLRTMKRRRFLNLLSGEYQSGATVFVSIDSTMLTIDKPMVWPGLKKVRIVFKDDAKVWNYITVSVIGEGKDTVKTKFPTELFRLQRRAHFRVEIPVGNTVSFSTDNGELVEDVAICNIGSGGMMLCFANDHFPDIKEQDVLSEIEMSLELPARTGDSGPKETELLYVAKGVCVRAFIDESTRKNCLGVKFKPGTAEEMKLTQFIRLLELDELRKGVAMQ